MTWFTDILNMLFTFLDRIVYGLITTLYQLLLYLANLDLFGMSTLTSTTGSSNVILDFSSRVYALLGIFMLFKVSFSILQYMVNPDEFSDKSKGFGKMVTNILVSLCLIVFIPYIFQFAFRVQGAILESNFLGHLILGDTVSGENIDDADMSVNEEMAEDLQFLVYGSFFSVDTNVINSCANGPVLGTKAMARERDCLTDLAEAFKDVGGASKLGDFFAAGGNDSVERRFDAFGEVVNIKKDGQYVFKYMAGISIIAGGFVVIMLLSFCIDVAVRIIKLGFLEIIAPIPIVSYMDPKQSGKDGMLGRWASECLKTYLSLFIRLAVIYFAFFVVDLVANEVLATDASDQLYLNGDVPTGLMAIFVQVMVIIGVFFFAKEVPKLLENLIPGMSGAGDLHFDRIKALGIGAAAGIGAGIGGFAANTIADVNWSGIRENAKGVKDELRGIAGSKHMTLGNKAKAIFGTVAGAGASAGASMLRGVPRVGRTALAGAGSAAIRGAYAGGTKKNFSTGVSRGIRGATDARNDRDIRQAAGYGVGKQLSDAAYRFANKKNKAGGVGAMDQQVKEWTQSMNDAEGREHATRDQLASWVGTNSSHSFREFQRAMFEPQLDKDGKIVMGENNTVIYDESKTRSYEDYLKTVQPGETVIDRNEFERFKAMQDDIIDANNTREYYRKQIKDYQDVMDIKNKKSD